MPQNAPPRDYGHIRALDGIRGFAVIAVFAYHSLTYSIDPITRMYGRLERVARSGWVGVDLFFVLSGFLITTILLDARAADNYFKVFYIRRALRILPLYYLVLIGALIAAPGHVSLKAQIFYWLNLSNLPTAFRPYLIPNLAHYWSLGIEEQFYFAWPALIRRLMPKTITYFCISVIVGEFLMRNLPFVIALNARWPDFVYRFTLFRIDTLCAGALLAVIVQEWPNMIERRVLLRAVFAVSASAALFLCYRRLYIAPSIIRFGYSAVVAASTSLIALALFPGSLTSRLFQNGFLRKTGKYSYCFYLLHPYVVNNVASHRNIFDKLLTGSSHNVVSIVIALFDFLVVFGLCALSWNFVEGPLLGLKRHFRYHPPPKRYLA